MNINDNYIYKFLIFFKQTQYINNNFYIYYRNKNYYTNNRLIINQKF